MWYLINTNKRRTRILLILMTCLLFVFGFFISKLVYLYIIEEVFYGDLEYKIRNIGLLISSIFAVGVIFYAKFNTNKRQTRVLLILMVCLFAFVFFIPKKLIYAYITAEVFYGDNYYPDLEYKIRNIGFLISFIFAVGVIFYTKIQGAKFFLNQVNAVQIDSHSQSVVKNVVEEMAIAANLGFIPKIYIINSKTPNAFAVGINAKNAAVAVTTGLLSVLNRSELQAVIAHEISHIKNQDTLYLMYAGIIFGAIVTVSDILIRSVSRSGRNNKGGAFILLLVIILAILSPIFAKLLYFSLSREREFLADACACQYTRYPMALALALKKISSFEEDIGYNLKEDEFMETGRVVSCMNIHNNLQKKAENFISELFSTHPPIEKRIKILSKMSHADLGEYTRKYSAIVSNKTLIPENILKNMHITPLAIVEKTAEEDIKTNKIIRQRCAKNEYKKAVNYKIIKCDCETFLKIPPDYIKESITCPHCNKIYNLKEKPPF